MSEEESLDINNSSQNDDLQGLLNASLYIDGYLTISHLLCIVPGIPLNLGVIALIVGLKRLHSHRTFTWLGVGFANTFVLLFHLVELQVAYWPSPAGEQLYAAIRGLPYTALLIGNFFSFLERHVCVKHSKWYKRHVTNCWIVVVGQFTFFIVVCFIIKAGSQLVTSFLSSQLEMNIWSDLKVYSSCLLAAFAVCIAAQVLMWTISGWNNNAENNESGGIDFRRTARHLESGISAEDNEDIDNPQANTFVRIGQERISRLDVDAARTVKIISLVHLISFIPVLVTLAHVVEHCQQHGHFDIPEETNKMDCTTIVQIMYYMRELVSIPCFSFSPIYFVYQSRDICAALRERAIYLTCRRPAAVQDSSIQVAARQAMDSESDENGFWSLLHLAAAEMESDSRLDSTATGYGIESISSMDDDGGADFDLQQNDEL